MDEIKIKSNISKSIIEYCKLNNIDNIENFTNDLLSKAFMVEKYGEKPFSENNKKENKAASPKDKEKVIKITKSKVKIIEND